MFEILEHLPCMFSFRFRSEIIFVELSIVVCWDMMLVLPTFMQSSLLSKEVYWRKG